VTIRTGLLVLFLLIATASSVPAAPAPAPTPGRDAAQEVKYYLSWRAPYGLPRAMDTAAPSCGDSTRIDTLWVSFEVSRSESTFLALAGELTITAEPGDTLSAFWQMGRGGANHGGLYGTFGPQEGFPGENPWATTGVGAVDYERTSSIAYFRFVYAVSATQGGPVLAGHRYTAGCLMVRGMATDPAGCQQPVCIDWTTADFAFDLAHPMRIHEGGSHVVARGAGAHPCRERPRAWRPRAPLSRPPAADSLRGH
jgi:hypothetical protein